VSNFLSTGPYRLRRVTDREIVVGVSGGSGALLAKRFVEIALAAKGLERLHLVISDAALQVARSEIAAGITSPESWVARLETSRAPASRLTIHDNADVGAPIASGSYPISGMAVVPCSAGTLGSIANGVSRDLLQRAADVCLKERRTLLLAFRESPYSLIHIENMRRAATAGAIIAPPLPTFYIDAPSVDRFLDAWCVRAARALGLEPRGEQFRWKGQPGKPGAKGAAGSRPRRRPR
jgi:4-hydroxy-3-polyprenylbenzoate decarboxylase